MLRNPEYERALDEAHAAAAQAIADKFAAGDAERPFNCGFAWVTMPANTAFARYCRANHPPREPGTFGRDFDRAACARYGSKAERGWMWWKPGAWPDGCYQQDMDFHLAAAAAFAKALGAHGIRADVGSRLD